MRLVYKVDIVLKRERFILILFVIIYPLLLIDF
jgi:hypothetical protein